MAWISAEWGARLKLAAIYNCWDGEELLEASIRQIRAHTEIILVVYQEQSNFEEPYSPLPTIERLQSIGLVDCAIPFLPTFNIGRGGGTVNETVKRNLGLAQARELNATHFLHIDCDEFYDTDQFRRAKATLERGWFESSACHLQTYYRRPQYQLSPPEEYGVPFIHKLYPGTHCGHQTGATRYPVECDPTRSVSHTEENGNVGNFKLFSRDELEMHHMSFVRKNTESFKRKLRNHSSWWKLTENLEQDATMFEQYEPGQPLVWFKGHSLLSVPDQFGIEGICEQ